MAAQTRDSLPAAAVPAVVPSTSTWMFQPSREVSAESSFDRPSRHGKRAHEGGGNVALLYGDFEFLACKRFLGNCSFVFL